MLCGASLAALEYGSPPRRLLPMATRCAGTGAADGGSRVCGLLRRHRPGAPASRAALPHALSCAPRDRLWRGRLWLTARAAWRRLSAAQLPPVPAHHATNRLRRSVGGLARSQQTARAVQPPAVDQLSAAEGRTHRVDERVVRAEHAGGLRTGGCDARLWLLLVDVRGAARRDARVSVAARARQHSTSGYRPGARARKACRSAPAAAARQCHCCARHTATARHTTAARGTPPRRARARTPHDCALVLSRCRLRAPKLLLLQVQRLPRCGRRRGRYRLRQAVQHVGGVSAAWRPERG
eukprot:4827764-Prymnesium_polylepis.1